MRIVIDIDEQDYEMACKYPYSLISVKAHVINNGTPLPKGHGDLIDRNVLLEEKRMRMYYHLKNGDTAIPIIDIEHAETVIQADKGGD